MSMIVSRIITIVFIICSSLLFSQSNIISVNGNFDYIYSKENSVSTKFYPSENGNLQLRNVFGIGFSYLKNLSETKNYYLKIGFENRRQNYSIEYFSFFLNDKNISFGYDFIINSSALSFGLQKQMNLFDGKFKTRFGIDLIARNYRTNFNKDFIDQDLNFISRDTVLLRFNTFGFMDLWPVQFELSSAIVYPINEIISVFSQFSFSPREIIGFNYNVTSIDTYEENSILKKQIHVDEKLLNKYLIRSFRFNVGIAYQF